MDKWEALLKKAGAHEDRIPAFVGLSRATYYRDKQLSECTGPLIPLPLPAYNTPPSHNIRVV